ncbi:MAG: di-trans,poly-cis-decaprenylcistransferase [Elusimicrobiaceae bacterium]|nr:di-trans,poly-cis-decaprenylcistransferase [Elusimicrobiaceae bacterium]
MNKPRHIAIIMDGNGRWAKLKKLPRKEGHKEGANSVEAVVQTALKEGIKVLSLYAFSTENWARPKTEVNYLMQLLTDTLSKFTEDKYKDVKLVFSGRRKSLPIKILNKLDEVIKATAGNKKITLNLCLNYGARQEITDAVNKILAQGKRKITESDIEKNLYQNLPAPDLIIRTSGEERLSNFLLWQAAYSEFYFTKTLWPDFKGGDLQKAISAYNQRDRRFGAR